MAQPTTNTYGQLPGDVPEEQKTFLNGYVVGIPVRDFGILQSLMIGVALGFVAFFVATFLGIMTLLVINASGHTVDFAMSYKLIGFPIGVAVALLGLTYMAFLWIRRQVTRR